jgi:hypothetical protein
MVSNLEYKERDPNFRRGEARYRVGNDRGAGYYYHRGNGWYSKYEPSLDAEEFHKRRVVTDRSKALRDKPHKADYKTRSSPRRSPKTTGGPRAGSRKGWF